VTTDYDKELAAVMNQDRALNEILKERKAQDAKWGEQNHDDKTWLAILVEEVGELAQAILHDEFGGRAAGTAREELVQVAAVAVQWLEVMGRRETVVTPEEAA
jgi:NTP pyrophosphatase (non-canonical NTP hydrolase)